MLNFLVLNSGSPFIPSGHGQDLYPAGRDLRWDKYLCPCDVGVTHAIWITETEFKGENSHRFTIFVRIVHKPFRIRTYKMARLKLIRMNTYEGNNILD